MNKVLFILFFILSGISFGQSRFLNKNEVSTLIDNGDLKVKEGDYFGAIHFYDLAYEIDSTTKGIIYRLAISNKGFHNYNKAMLLLMKIDKDIALKNSHPTYLFHIADILKREGKYEESEKAFKKFLSTYKLKNDYYYRKAKNEVNNFNKVYDLLKDTVDVEITNLGDNLNTGNAEFNSYFISDTNIIFSTHRSNEINDDGSVDEKEYYFSIYKGIKQDSVWKIDSNDVFSSKKCVCIENWQYPLIFANI